MTVMCVSELINHAFQIHLTDSTAAAAAAAAAAQNYNYYMYLQSCSVTSQNSPGKSPLCSSPSMLSSAAGMTSVIHVPH